MKYSKFGDLYYPVKANDHKIILKEIDKLNGFFEVDGIYHITLLLSLGISPKKIQYSIPIKKELDIKRALELGVTRFVIDDSKEYKKISFFKYDVDYIIRISISDILDLDSFGFNKWGLPITNVKKLIKQIENDGNTFCGISFYLPKELFTSTNFSIMINRIIKEFHDVNIPIIDIGGGLDYYFSEEFEQEILKLKDRMKLNKIIVEPGRNLIDPCIDMIASVIGIRNFNKKLWAYIDVGIYSGLLDAIIKKKKFSIHNIQNNSIEGNFEYIIAGPSSDTIDIIGHYCFNSPLNEGDKLIIKECGSYTYVFRTHFGGFEQIDFVVV